MCQREGKEGRRIVKICQREGRKGRRPGKFLSGEGEVTEEERKAVVSEKEGNTTALSGEIIMDSVGSTK